MKTFRCFVCGIEKSGQGARKRPPSLCCSDCYDLVERIEYPTRRVLRMLFSRLKALEEKKP